VPRRNDGRIQREECSRGRSERFGAASDPACRQSAPPSPQISRPIADPSPSRLSYGTRRSGGRCGPSSGSCRPRRHATPPARVICRCSPRFYRRRPDRVRRSDWRARRSRAIPCGRTGNGDGPRAGRSRQPPHPTPAPSIGEMRSSGTTVFSVRTKFAPVAINQKSFNNLKTPKRHERFGVLYLKSLMSCARTTRRNSHWHAIGTASGPGCHATRQATPKYQQRLLAWPCLGTSNIAR